MRLSADEDVLLPVIVNDFSASVEAASQHDPCVGVFLDRCRLDDEYVMYASGIRPES